MIALHFQIFTSHFILVTWDSTVVREQFISISCGHVARTLHKVVVSIIDSVIGAIDLITVGIDEGVVVTQSSIITTRNCIITASNSVIVSLYWIFVTW